LNALCDDPGAVEGIFEEPVATIRHVQHLFHSHTGEEAERYRKWLLGLLAAHRRRPPVPTPAVEPANEPVAAVETANSFLPNIVHENVQPKPLNLDTLLAQMHAAMSETLPGPAPDPVVKMPEVPDRVAQALAQLKQGIEPIPQSEPAPESEAEPDDGLDGVTFEDAQAFIMAALLADGYELADLDLDAIERAADGDETAMANPLAAYARAQQERGEE
jgi:hypothetical protein